MIPVKSASRGSAGTLKLIDACLEFYAKRSLLVRRAGYIPVCSLSRILTVASHLSVALPFLHP